MLVGRNGLMCPLGTLSQQAERRLVSDRTSRTTEVVTRLLRASLASLCFDSTVAKELVAQAYSVLESANCELPTPCEGSNGGLAPWQIKRAQLFIESNLESRFYVDDIAGSVGLSVSHFQRGFKLSFGMNTWDYVTRRRVDRAKELMLASDIGLADVAQAVGFSDQSHLSARFRRQIGVSPGQWRLEHKRMMSVGDSLALLERSP
jgi:AraC family transcriptional regulator